MTEQKNIKNIPFWDEKLPAGERISWLLSQMTLEEKFGFLATRTPALERFGIGAFSLGGEAAHGVEARHDQGKVSQPEDTTSFSQPIGMSATWDPELLEKVGTIVGKEARVLYNRHRDGGLSRWAPTIDMERDPRWGRTEEAYGEDPYLTGKMASSYISGLQGRDPYYLRMAASLKHFYANNVEMGRVWKSSSIDPRNKQEYYLEPFRMAVKEGHAEAMMTAYNEINGVPGILNHEVEEVVKKEWGLKGHIVCDGGDMTQTVDFHHYFGTHAETVAEALKAGVDSFTDDPGEVKKAVKEAWELGLITEEDIDRALRNVFYTKIRLGIYDRNPQNPYASVDETDLNSREGAELSFKSAAEGAVLLKNEGEALPLKKEEKVVLVGPLCDTWNTDWYGGHPLYKVTVKQGMEKLLGRKLPAESGLSELKLRVDGEYLGLDEKNRLVKVKEKEKAETFVFQDWGWGSHTFYAKGAQKFLTVREEIHEENKEEDPILYVCAEKEEVFGWFVKELFTLRPVGIPKAEEIGKSAFAKIAGEKRREVRLLLEKIGKADQGAFCRTEDPETEERMRRADYEISETNTYELDSWDDCVLVQDEKGALFLKNLEDATEQETVHLTVEVITDGVEKAVAAVKQADKAVLVLGSNPVVNSKEEIDRSDLILPPSQERLMRAVYEANPNTVLLLVANYPYAACWAKEHIPAILQMASGSQELGNAAAAVLFGECSPAGRLPMTWYRSVDDLPDMDDYDIIKGERTYQYFRGPVLWPFGHGLSYTTFKYEDLRVEKTENRELKISLNVVNTGKAAADEVVQIYVKAPENSSKKLPVHRLKAFQRIKNIKPGEVRSLNVTVPVESLAFYDVKKQAMSVMEGEYEIQAGSSSREIRLRQKVYVEGEPEGVRKADEITAAYYYDDYENAILHKGSAGYSCVQPKHPETPMVLHYQNFTFDKAPSVFVCNLMAREEAGVTVSLDGKPCGFWRGKGADTAGTLENGLDTRSLNDAYVNVRLPLKDAKAGEGIDLSIEVRGNAKVCRFWFE